MKTWTSRSQEGLRRRGFDVTTSVEAGLLSSTDVEQLAHAATNGRVLVTHDDDFLARHEQGVEHAGLAYCHAQSRSVGEIIRALELIAEVLKPDDMRNHVEFV